ncbi:MAG: DUF1961 family protein [Lentisphaeraceae bacterium]|nr:DUF1961 family protein [Lentisphaeraceae bacterium]
MSIFKIYFYCILLAGYIGAEDKQAHEKFAEQNSKNWQMVFLDPMVSNWQEKWFLDGQFAKVSNSGKYLCLNTESTETNERVFGVLWTKKSFKGDIRIEYDFKNVNKHFKGVNIIYIQATGDGQKDHQEDISKWSDKRTKAIMSNYFLNMHSYHISYAAFGNKPDVEYKDYVRGRRYLPEANQSMKNTKMKGEYVDTGLFKDQQWIHVTIIKNAKELWVEFKHPNKTLLCNFKNETNPSIEKGRIGLRLMPKRVSHFKNFKVFVPVD